VHTALCNLVEDGVSVTGDAVGDVPHVALQVHAHVTRVTIEPVDVHGRSAARVQQVWQHTRDLDGRPDLSRCADPLPRLSPYITVNELGQVAREWEEQLV